MRRAELGDTVRILSTPDTIAAGYAERTGTCYGFTTPSMTGVQVIGATEADDALNVGFDDGTSAWFDPSLVAFVDFGAGQAAMVGNAQFIRGPNGEWVGVPPQTDIPTEPPRIRMGGWRLWTFRGVAIGGIVLAFASGLAFSGVLGAPWWVLGLLSVAVGIVGFAIAIPRRYWRWR